MGVLDWARRNPDKLMSDKEKEEAQQAVTRELDPEALKEMDLLNRQDRRKAHERKTGVPSILERLID